MSGAAARGDAVALRFAARIRRAGFIVEASFACERPATALFGPSGAGKTTILDAIAGLVRPEAGEISIGGETLFDSARGIDLAPERRGIGYVFQDGALFPHRSVKGNLLYGRRRRRLGAGIASLDDVVDLLDLAPLLDRRPARLSGGERRRVAIGRAMLSSPRFLLLDEPLVSLDAGLQDRILPYLLRVRDECRVPFLYVSHALAEVAEVAEEVIVIEGGRVAGQGKPLDVLARPEVFPIAQRLGIENALEVEVIEDEPAEGTSVARLGAARIKIPVSGAGAGARILVTIRADEVLLAVEEPRGLSARNILPAEIREVREVGGNVLVTLDAGAIMVAEVTPEARRDLALEPGRRAFAVVKTRSFRVRGAVGVRRGK